MATTGVDIVPASDVELRADPKYQKLLAACHEINQKARLALIHYHYKLGERIRSFFLPGQDSTYGSQVVQCLEEDLVLDRTTLWRAIQCYDTYRSCSEKILSESPPTLNWSMVRMLIPIEDDATRDYFYDRIASGELRTAEDLRTAIRLYEVQCGKLPPPTFGDTDPEVLGIKGRHWENLQIMWRSTDPGIHANIMTTLIPRLGLEGADDVTKKRGFREIDRAWAEYKRRAGVKDD